MSKENLKNFNHKDLANWLNRAVKQDLSEAAVDDLYKEAKAECIEKGYYQLKGKYAECGEPVILFLVKGFPIWNA